MGKKLPVIVALAAIGAGAAGWIAWDQTHSAGVRNGQAFGADGASATIGMTTVRKGDEVWYIAPAPTNLSDAELTLEAVTPEATSPGLGLLETSGMAIGYSQKGETFKQVLPATFRLEAPPAAG